jgi:thiol-disulfide isomerase/thioredoxin
MIVAHGGFLRVVVAAIAVVLPALSMQAVAAEAPAGFAVHESARPLPDIRFENGQGEATSLAEFRGKVVLLNIWATWCAPCRREMPTLDRLQAELGGPGFEVVALSIDRQGRGVVFDFYQELGLRQLDIYVDPSGKAQRELNALGVPTTLLIDGEGNEVGRLLGPAEWDGPEMVAFIRSYVEPRSGVVPGSTRDQLQSASLYSRPSVAGHMH